MAEGIELITAHTGASHVSVDDKQALYMGVFGDHGGDATKPLRLWQPTLDGATVTGTNSVTIPPCIMAYHGWIVRIVTPVSLNIPTGSAGQTTTSYVNVRILSENGSQRAEISCDRTINSQTGGSYPSGFTPWVLTRNGLDAPTVTSTYQQVQPITAITSRIDNISQPWDSTSYFTASKGWKIDRLLSNKIGPWVFMSAELSRTERWTCQAWETSEMLKLPDWLGATQNVTVPVASNGSIEQGGNLYMTVSRTHIDLFPGMTMDLPVGRWVSFSVCWLAAK